MDFLLQHKITAQNMTVTPIFSHIKYTNEVIPQDRKKKGKKKKDSKEKITFIAITGGHGSGKTKVAEYLKKYSQSCEIISERSFFFPNKNPREVPPSINFVFNDFPEYSKERRLYLIDSCNPKCYNYDQMYDVLKKIQNGDKTKIPFFDEKNMKFVKRLDYVIDPDKIHYVIVEGSYFLNDKRIMSFFKDIIFRDVQDDIRLTRLILREKEDKFLKKNPQAYQMFFTIYKHFMKESYNKIIAEFKKESNFVLQSYDYDKIDELDEDETLHLLQSRLNINS